MITEISRYDRFKGLMLGTAVGDSLGLTAEGLNPARIKRLFPGRWQQRFIMGHGMVSDDTEHTCFVAQSILNHPDFLDKFRRSLAWKLRFWLLGLPAGIGSATLRSIIKLWLGFSPLYSGVWSAGNGPAMRAAVVGAYFADSREMIDRYIQAATLITHRDPRALTGALAIAHLAGWVIRNNAQELRSADEIFLLLKEVASTDDKEWQQILRKLSESYRQGLSVSELAIEMGLKDGITGFIYHTVPMAIYGWLKSFGEFEKTLISVLDCGGDTDTVAAITGALAGLTVGEQGIPKLWIDNIWDWPFGPAALRDLANSLADQQSGAVHLQKDKFYLTSNFYGLIALPRNLLFFLIVLKHIIRRTLPPY